MYRNIILNDFKGSRVVSLTTLVFVAAAAMLVSLAAILVINLAGAMDTLMTRARTPHFMQMHAGAINTARLSAFAERNGNVDMFQVVEFLNIDGARMSFNGKSLADNVQDNGLSVQGEGFDYLLDLDGNAISASDGEIYVPLCYMRDKTARVGDKAVVCGKEFTVAGFLRDSQMNSTLSSSKRFLVSEADFEGMKGFGRTEYLIEFRLKDLSGLGAFETAYASAGLEANGPTLTYPLFKMINALSDGMMIGVILLVGMLVVSIAFMCIRFTLLAKIEDDYREIGVMKAIGLRVSDIKGVYLAKYAVIAAAGCALGFVLSFAFRGMLLENIRLFMGEGGNPTVALFFGVLGVLLVFLAIMAYVNGVLKRFRRISAAEAIRFGASRDKAVGSGRFGLGGSRLLGTNAYLGIRDVLSRKGLYATMLAVLVISAFIMAVPRNLHSTISDKGFITYMGVGDCDLRIDVQQTDGIPEKTAAISGTMARDGSISSHTVLTTKAFTARMGDGTDRSIKVELGDHSAFPVEYSKGRAPADPDEIALSAANADGLGKGVGDDLVLMIGGKAKNLTVCGTYSDITNGGKTAKAVFTDDSADVMKSVICAELTDESLVDGKVSEYAGRFGYAKVSDIDEYISQTFGPTMDSIGTASRASIAVALLISVLVTLLFMQMLVAKDRYPIAVLKACGFTDRDITAQFAWRSVFVLLVGVVLGTLLANTLGQVLAGMVISSFGASSFRFTVNPLFAYLVNPLSMVGAVLIATAIGTLGVGRIKIPENIKE